MALFKGFTAYLVDSTGENILENLGTFVLSIMVGDRSYSRTLNPNFSGYVDSPEKIGTAFFAIAGVGDQEDRYNAITPFAPITVLRTCTQETNGARIKLVNSSGYYAISALMSAYPSVVSTFNLYDNNGNLIFANYSGLTGQVPNSEQISIPVVKGVDENGNATGTIRTLTVLTRIGGSNFNVYGEISTARTNNDFLTWLNGLTQHIDNPDPYEQDPAGESAPGGGTGTFDGTGDSIDFPSLPSLSAVDTGFISLFNPTIAQLKTLANYLWGSAFDISTWKKIFADPMDAVLGMSIVPVAVPDGGGAAVAIGNINTGITMNKAAGQYVEVDCGTLNVEEYWGAYLDYDPYTKAEIYLPYIGTHPLAVDDIMGKAVHVKYHVDILSGSCCAYVKCGGSVMYSFVGQCSCSVPITGNDWTNVINGALSIAASIGTMVATGGASAPMAAATIASTAVNSMKPNVEKSGSMGGMGGMLGIQTPYLILTRPRQAIPARQNTFMGYPSFVTMLLGDCSGYTEIEKVHLENIPATEQELSEIENLLKGGVIL